jgi:hypothetical protein
VVGDSSLGDWAIAGSGDAVSAAVVSSVVSSGAAAVASLGAGVAGSESVAAQLITIDPAIKAPAIRRNGNLGIVIPPVGSLGERAVGLGGIEDSEAWPQWATLRYLFALFDVTEAIHFCGHS